MLTQNNFSRQTTVGKPPKEANRKEEEGQERQRQNLKMYLTVRMR